MPAIDGAEHAQDGVIPRFYMRAILDELKTEKEGHPIYRDVEWVDVTILGSNATKPSLRVTDEHRQRWSRQYAAFVDGREYIEKGYVLSEWQKMQPALVATLKAQGIHTVEQFAQLGLPQVKMLGSVDLWEQAKKIAAGRDEKQEQLDELLEANKALEARLEALEAEKAQEGALDASAQSGGAPAVEEVKPDPMAKARAAKKAKAGKQKAAVAAGS